MADSQSRNEAILQAMIDDTEYTEEPQSRNEAILLAMLNDTEYNDPPQSRIEDLLLQLKEKGGGGGEYIPKSTELLNCTDNVTVTEV